MSEFILNRTNNLCQSDFVEGYWDRDQLNDMVGEALSKSASSQGEAFGNVDLYVGDDGLVWS